jgi:Xaa-Pro aminopeptidase
MDRGGLGRMRLRLLREEMQKQDVEILVLTDRESKMWLTGNDSSMVVLVSSDPGERVACYVDSTNIPWFKEGAWLDAEIYERRFTKEQVASLWRKGNALSSQWELNIKDLHNIMLHEYNKKRKVAIDSLPWTGTLEWLKAFPGYPLEDATPIFWHAASVKDAHALKRSMLAAEIAFKMMRVGVDSLRNGVTEASVEEQMTKVGCQLVSEAEGRMDSIHPVVHFEDDKSEAIVSFGRKTSYVHGAPGKPKLKENDVARLIALANVDHYWSEFELTIPFGQPPREVTELLGLKRQVLRLSIEACRAGEPIFEVHRKARTFLDSYGFWDGAPIGHGLGLKFHELPFIDRPIKSELSNTAFQNDQVFAVEPDFYIQEKWGFRDSAMIVIKDQIPKVLADPAEFEA